VLSVAVELHHTRSKFDSIASIQQFVTDRLNYLVTARPTAVNMADAARTMIQSLTSSSNNQSSMNTYIDELLDLMEKFLERDLADNQSIGRFGAEIIRLNNSQTQKVTVLTHCNTGSLATVGFGTALGVIRQLAAENTLELAYFTETRPYNQGSRLTAYELVHDRIPHTMICDSMAGLLMRTRSIHAVVVGADRVTANGDTANKIGT
jgi:methylthioribose-1-phosphate isomerase